VATIASRVESGQGPYGSPCVFFFDRLSPGAVALAEAANRSGACVVFEPSARSGPSLLGRALAVTHLLKYAHGRKPGVVTNATAPGVFLEIETLGKQGLRYRLPTRTGRRWHHLQGLNEDRVVDEAGAGDWCTAALLNELCAQGGRGLTTSSSERIAVALQRSQIVASLACRFPGARGLMYAMNAEAINCHVTQMTLGHAPQTIERRRRPRMYPPPSDLCTECMT
jgi:fructokinase